MSVGAREVCSQRQKPRVQHSQVLRRKHGSRAGNEEKGRQGTDYRLHVHLATELNHKHPYIYAHTQTHMDTHVHASI